MRLFCSTEHRKQPRPPLPSASEFSHLSGYDIWSISLPISQFLDQVRALLAERTLVSACIFSKPPPEGKEWLFFEWHGRLLIDLDLVDEILSGAGGWKKTQVSEELNIAVFEPADFPVSDFSTQAAHYRELLESGEQGEVILRREWLDTKDARKRLFGQYADPKVGGAIALLSLSGAAKPDAHEFALRTPAALGLDIDTSSESIVAVPIRDKFTIRCLGCSDLSDLKGAEDFETSFDRWTNLYEKSRNSLPTSFFLALELDATVDPTIAIRRGVVFEQQTLVAIQTLAAAGDERTIVEPGEVKPLIIPAYCLNADLRPPHGQPMRPTPFVYRKATGTQDEVWRTQRGG